MSLPFIVHVPEEDDYYRKRWEIRVPLHLRLTPLFGNIIPDLQVYRAAKLDWVEDGCYHRKTNLLLGCLRGAVNVAMRLVKPDGTSWHKLIRLTEEGEELLVIPAGVWYTLASPQRTKSCLLVWASRATASGTELDEVSSLPAGYDLRTSCEFAIETEVAIEAT